MKTWTGAGIVTAGILTSGVLTSGLAFADPAATGSPATAANARAQTKAQTAGSPKTAGLSARQRYRHDRHGDRPSEQPYYYGRPTDYRPYPYDFPAPFFLGVAFGPL